MKPLTKKQVFDLRMKYPQYNIEIMLDVPEYWNKENYWEVVNRLFGYDYSEEFVREFKDRVNWKIYCHNNILTEDFIIEFKDYVNWDGVSSCQTLSENFIRDFKDKVVWNLISAYQILSEEFIREFKDYVDWSNIFCWQNNISEEFIKEFKDKLIESNCIRELLCRNNINEITLSKEFVDELTKLV